jgi:hypothetical protein
VVERGFRGGLIRHGQSRKSGPTSFASSAPSPNTALRSCEKIPDIEELRGGAGEMSWFVWIQEREVLSEGAGTKRRHARRGTRGEGEQSKR